MRSYQSVKPRSKRVNFYLRVKHILATSRIPLDFTQIISKIHLPPTRDLKEQIQKILRTFLKEESVFMEGNTYILGSPKYKDLYIEATISITPAGYGYASPKDRAKFPNDIFIPKQFLNNAMQEDSVIVGKISSSLKGYEGAITEVISRKKNEIIAIITEKYQSGVYKAVSKTASHINVFIQSDITLNYYDVVEASIGNQENMHLPKDDPNLLLGHFQERLGNLRNPNIDNTIAKIENHIPGVFSQEVQDEANAMDLNIASNLEGRVDCRDQDVFTIDPTTSKDFDDAISIKKDKETGKYTLHVHIADVTHYVKPKTSVDKEAQFRCNSTYLPNEVVPMLPFKLSDNLCSLLPNEDRLASSVMMKFDKDGKILDYKVFKSIINSKRRFSYEEAREIIDGESSDPFKEILDLAAELHLAINEMRLKAGYIPLNTKEIKIEVDDNGNPIAAKLVEHDIAHKLIETFMVMANETIAFHISTKLHRPCIFRMHESPDQKQSKIFVDKIRTLGIEISSHPSREEIRQIMENYSHTPLGALIAVDYVQHMNQAIYSTDNKGHYGLNLDYYCHFTSPIRRYADLMIHRLLFEKSYPSIKELNSIAHKCSDKERISARAEKYVVKHKKLRYLINNISSNPNKKYQCVVTRVMRNKILAEITEIQHQITLPLSSFTDGFYTWDEERQSMISPSGAKISKGTMINIAIDDVSLIDDQLKLRVLSYENIDHHAT